MVLVLPADQSADAYGADRVALGGLTRSESVRRGLDRVPAEADIIVIHDAARPLARPELFASAIAAVRGGADGAVLRRSYGRHRETGRPDGTGRGHS